MTHGTADRQDLRKLRPVNESKETDLKWINAQRRAPASGQMCLVIGEPKTSKNISCFVAVYSERKETFLNTSMHRIHVPRAKARWWLPIKPPGVAHPMDAPSNG